MDTFDIRKPSFNISLQISILKPVAIMRLQMDRNYAVDYQINWTRSFLLIKKTINYFN